MDLSKFLAFEEPTLYIHSFILAFYPPFEGISCCRWFWWVSIHHSITHYKGEVPPLDPLAGRSRKTGPGHEAAVWQTDIESWLGGKRMYRELTVSDSSGGGVKPNRPDSSSAWAPSSLASYLFCKASISAWSHLYPLGWFSLWKRLPESFSGDCCLRRQSKGKKMGESKENFLGNHKIDEPYPQQRRKK